MKNLLTCLVVILLTINIGNAQTVYTPDFDRKDESNITLDKIEKTTTYTILYFTHTASESYQNGGWVNIRPTTFLKETYGTRKYKLIKAEGVPYSPAQHNYSYKGQKLSFRLFFPLIHSSINKIDLIECEDSRDCFNFYGISISNSSSSSEARGRGFLREQIKKWGECKNVAMTLTGGDVAVYGKNGWAAQGAPSGMTKKLESLNEENKLIDDIVITEEGRWLIQYGTNGVAWNDIPASLERKLRQFNEANETITSVTFNDSGDWIVITKKKIAASTDKLNSFIEDGMERYGGLWAAHMTEDGLVLCFEKGYKFLGNVPQNLKDKLEETKLNVYRIKFLSDGAYFIADDEGNYAFNL
jgi:hypothetical protein